MCWPKRSLGFPPADLKTTPSPRGINASDSFVNMDMSQVSAKVDKFKKKTIRSFKNSRQQLLEHMGKIDKTSDNEFEQLCEKLKELHKLYGTVFIASRQFSQAANNLAMAEKLLGESLYQLSMKEDNINPICEITSGSMQLIGRNATTLDNSLQYFLSSMETLYAKSIADTLDTIHLTEEARLEYDVNRHDLSKLSSQRSTSSAVLREVQSKTEFHRQRYEALKADVRIKFQLLEENRIGVMSNQLEKLQAALCAYYSGNSQLLSRALQELEVLKSPQNSTPI